jgi:hypothetical protein
MTISSTTVKNSYNGNGSTRTFVYTFKIFQDSDLQVIIRSANGTETIKTLNTHYTITGAGNSGGGSVTFLQNLPSYDYTPTASEKIILIRNIPQTQSLDYISNDTFPAESHEEGLDRTIMVVQQLQEEVNRSIKLSKTNTMNSTEFFIDASSRAGKIFGFDSNGELVVSQELGTYKGNWSTATTYSARDIVKDTSNNNIYFCNTGHTSTGTTPISSNADTAKWNLLVDAASATASATAAASSASSAASSASASSSSASSASSSATAAANSYDSFDDRYLGAKASDPTLDNDSNALIDGALYFDTTNNVMKVYDLGNTTWRRTTPTSVEQTNINTVAGISGNVTTVADNITKVNEVYTEILKVVEVANDLQEATSEIEVVANNIANVNTVGTNITNVNIAGANINSVNDFVARYRVSSTQPTTSLDIGDLWYDTANSRLKIYTSSGWEIASDYVSSLINVYNYTATAGQTIFTGADSNSRTLSFTTGANCFVFLNGVRIILDQDYTLTGGNTLTLTVPANVGDLIYIEVIAKISITQEAILQGYVSSASGSASTATTKASEASTSATNAATSASSASSSASSASSSATNASNSASSAATQATNAANSATSSSASAATATTKASEANTSATNAASSASSALSSKNDAATSATAAQTAQTAVETIFDNFDDRFLGSKTSDPTLDNDGNSLSTGTVYYNSVAGQVRFYNGATWDSPAASATTSASNAATSASNAATSASSASSSASTASTQASNAASSASSASTHATNASSSSSSASSSATSASTSASTATTQAGIATTKASEASTSASNASTSASNASTSATNAASSATAAASSATSASTSASSASTSATNASSSLTTFNNKYLGTKTSDPTLDNSGNALTVGALYFNSVSNLMKVYSGSAWLTAYASLDASVFSELVFTPTSGQTTFTTSYTVNYVQVFVNGIKLLNGVDFTATNGTSIVLTESVGTTDRVEIVKFK